MTLFLQDRYSITAAITTGLQHFGTIDALINNAGAVFEKVQSESLQEI